MRMILSQLSSWELVALAASVLQFSCFCWVMLYGATTLRRIGTMKKSMTSKSGLSNLKSGDPSLAALINFARRPPAGETYR